MKEPSSLLKTEYSELHQWQRYLQAISRWKTSPSPPTTNELAQKNVSSSEPSSSPKLSSSLCFHTPSRPSSGSSSDTSCMWAWVSAWAVLPCRPGRPRSRRRSRPPSPSASHPRPWGVPPQCSPHSDRPSPWIGSQIEFRHQFASSFSLNNEINFNSHHEACLSSL